MKNWKTTLFGTIAGVGGLMSSPCLQQAGIPVPPILAQLGPIITLAGTVGLGIAAKDSNVTGGTKQQ